MAFLLVVTVVPSVCTATAVAQLAGSFKPNQAVDRQKVVVAMVSLLVTATWVAVTASGPGYSIVAAAFEMIVACIVTVIGAIPLVLKPPRARRMAAGLLITVYPLLLFVVLEGTNMIRNHYWFIKIAGG